MIPITEAHLDIRYGLFKKFSTFFHIFSWPHKFFNSFVGSASRVTAESVISAALRPANATDPILFNKGSEKSTIFTIPNIFRASCPKTTIKHQPDNSGMSRHKE